MHIYFGRGFGGIVVFVVGGWKWSADTKDILGYSYYLAKDIQVHGWLVARTIYCKLFGRTKFRDFWTIPLKEGQHTPPTPQSVYASIEL